MVRAILREGRIQPLDPLPKNWHEGQELAVATLDDDETSESQQSVDRWHEERLALSVGLTDEDDRLVQQALEEQRQSGKETMRREWEHLR